MLARGRPRGEYDPPWPSTLFFPDRATSSVLPRACCRALYKLVCAPQPLHALQLFQQHEKKAHVSAQSAPSACPWTKRPRPTFHVCAPRNLCTPCNCSNNTKKKHTFRRNLRLRPARGQGTRTEWTGDTDGMDRGQGRNGQGTRTQWTMDTVGMDKDGVDTDGTRTKWTTDNGQGTRTEWTRAEWTWTEGTESAWTEWTRDTDGTDKGHGRNGQGRNGHRRNGQGTRTAWIGDMGGMDTDGMDRGHGRNGHGLHGQVTRTGWTRTEWTRTEWTRTEWTRAGQRTEWTMDRGHGRSGHGWNGRNGQGTEWIWMERTESTWTEWNGQGTRTERT
jgi:hypothetical protein